MTVVIQYAPISVVVSQSGAISIPFPWSIRSIAHIRVTMGAGTVMPASAYSVVSDLINGGTVVITSAWNDAQTKPITYTVARATPLEQPDVYNEFARIPSQVLQGSLDNLARQIQEISSTQDAQEGGVSDISARMDIIEPKVGVLETKVSSLEPRVSTLETQVGSLEPRVYTLEQASSGLKTEIISIVEKNVAQDGLINAVTGGLASHIAAPNPHPQYVLREELTEGIVFDSIFELNEYFDVRIKASL